MKERVGSSARNGDGEGGMNDVHATSILGSRLGRPDGFGCSPVGHAVLDVPLEEGHKVGFSICIQENNFVLQTNCWLYFFHVRGLLSPAFLPLASYPAASSISVTPE